MKTNLIKIGKNYINPSEIIAIYGDVETVSCNAESWIAHTFIVLKNKNNILIKGKGTQDVYDLITKSKESE